MKNWSHEANCPPGNSEATSAGVECEASPFKEGGVGILHTGICGGTGGGNQLSYSNDIVDIHIELASTWLIAIV